MVILPGDYCAYTKFGSFYGSAYTYYYFLMLDKINGWCLSEALTSFCKNYVG